MKNNNFPLLNELCEEFFQYSNSPFVGNNILPLADLCKCLISLSKTIEYDYMEVINRKNDSFKTMMLPEESIQICEEFLDKIHPSLKEQFQTFLKNGVINLHIDDGKNKLVDVQREYYGRQESYPDVNVGIYYNLSDPNTMIHEFFHGSNFVPSYLTKQDKRKSETHRILSETISVYFEERMISYLKKLGYPAGELDQLSRRRYIDSMECSRFLLDELAILDCYQRIGRISLEDYRLIKSSEDHGRSLVFENEEDFIDCCTKVENKLKEGYQPININSATAYTFGVSLALLLVDQENNIMDEKMIVLNERIKNIGSYPNLFDNIAILGISLNKDFNEKVVNVFKGKMEAIEPICKNRNK